MTVKKTVKRTVKKRRKARKVVSIDSVVAALQENASLSTVNKRALSRLSKADTAVERLEKRVGTAADRVSKAASSVASAKTATAKQRVVTARNGLKEVKASLSTAVSEQRKAQRLVRGLGKSLSSVQAKMAKDYDKLAKAAEKTADKTTRRRRTRKEKAVKTA